LHPGEGNGDNLYDYSAAQLKQKKIGILPQNLNLALDALENDQVIRDALGDGLSSEFLTLKRAEWIEYMRHVSDWEIKRYVEFF